jgi:hypothetical protein
MLSIIRILILSALIFVNCTVLTVEKYYAPTDQKLKTKRYHWYPCAGPDIMNTGPKHIAIIDTLGIQISVRCDNIQNIPILSGPMYILVIPLFTFTLFHTNFYLHQYEKNELAFSVRLSDTTRIGWNLSKTILMINQSKFYSPVQIEKTDRFTLAGPAREFLIVYKIPQEKIDSFQFYPGYITVDSDTIALKPIHFKKSKGLILCGAP